MLETDRLHKVVDLVEAELVVLLEEDEAVENAQVGVRVEVPDVLQVMIVEHDKRVAVTASVQPDDVPVLVILKPSWCCYTHTKTLICIMYEKAIHVA